MPLLNYTTKIEAIKTVGEIQRNLARHGAKSILTSYDSQGQIESLSFQVTTTYGDIGYRLPVDPSAVLKVLQRQNDMGKVPRSYVNPPQAVRIAWRIIKDWVEAQMAILETEMVKMEQVFLPYMVDGSGKTLYEAMADTKFQLKEGKMKPKQVYIGQPVALASRPGEMLGVILGIEKKIIEVKLNGGTGTQQYGVKVLVAYKGGK